MSVEKPLLIKRRFSGSLNTDEDDRTIQFFSAQTAAIIDLNDRYLEVRAS